jgi:hypothetical protein
MPRKLDKLMPFLMGLLVLAFAVAHMACSPAQVDSWLGAKKQIDTEISVQKASVEQMRARAATMPSDAPGLKQVQDGLAKADATLSSLQKQSAALDVAINEVLAGQLSGKGVGDLISQIPGVGPYGTLIALAASSLWGAYERNARRTTAAQIASAWHAEGPTGTTPALTAQAELHGIALPPDPATAAK